MTASICEFESGTDGEPFDTGDTAVGEVFVSGEAEDVRPLDRGFIPRLYS